MPQEAWIQNATVKNNILFGNGFSKTKYKQVLNACALEADLAILPGGDSTEIGEKVRGKEISSGETERGRERQRGRGGKREVKRYREG